MCVRESGRGVDDSTYPGCVSRDLRRVKIGLLDLAEFRVERGRSRRRRIFFLLVEEAGFVVEGRIQVFRAATHEFKVVFERRFRRTLNGTNEGMNG